MLLRRWLEAGLLDAATAERIRAWEVQHGDAGSQHRLAAIAFGLGGLLLMAGAFLFVSSHWDAIPPGGRFALVLGMVALFHVGAALSAQRSPRLATTLHAVGTATLGAGIFLCGQIFNMAEHWPGALLLWSVGAAAGLYWLRDWPHVLWLAVLVPGWAWGEWYEGLEGSHVWGKDAAPNVGLVLLSMAYLSAAGRDRDAPWRRVLSRLGALTLIPACIQVGLAGGWFRSGLSSFGGEYTTRDIAAWAVALLLPCACAWVLRGRQALYLIAPLVWSLLLAYGGWHADRSELAIYGLYAIGAVGLAALGIREHRRIDVNLGVAGFALTVMGFYFSSVFDRLGRSLGLIGMGLLFLGGGWLMERTRRRLISHIDKGDR
jgi:uncharacterized membrane protein